MTAKRGAVGGSLARLRWAVLSVGVAWVLAGCPNGDGGGGVGGY